YMLKDSLRGKKGIKLRLHDSTTSELEGVLARGDRRIGDVVERAYKNGAFFDSWDEHFNKAAWSEAFEHFGVDTGPFLTTLPLDARLPWDHIDVGLEDGFLAREYQKALHSRLSPPCGKAKGMFIHHTNVNEAEADARKLVCYDCGIACDLSRMRQSRVGFLSKMGALEPGRHASLPVVQPEPERKKKSPEMFRPARPGSPPVRVRLKYEKRGPAALLGHLDFIRELPRMIRRAGVRTAYTEGFHLKPDMSFGPALALGIASVGEYVDIKLIDPPESQELVERLNQVAASGGRFLGDR